MMKNCQIELHFASYLTVSPLIREDGFLIILKLFVQLMDRLFLNS